jgi:type VII secretion integral membrane protein EccD
VTGVGELIELAEPHVISAAAERVRLSFLADRTQVDVSLPRDVPIAGLLPELVKLVRSRESAESDDGPLPKEAEQNVWTLSRLDSKASLSPNMTLRDVDVADGELLRLSAERALSAPTLYDDVVDAAARLNKAGYPSWNATAARWMAFAGVHLASVVWTYFLLSHALASNRGALMGLSAVVAVSLVGAGALAHRSYGQSDIGAALGWAALPITSAIAWDATSGLGSYGASGGSAAMVIVCVTFFRAIGTGHAGYLATGIFFGLSGIAVAVHAAGITAPTTGAGLAVIATLCCLAVPLIKARSARITPPPVRERESAASAHPFALSEETSPSKTDASAAEAVWAHGRSAALTRTGAYTGLAASAGVGAAVVLLSSAHLQWAALTFALVCGATLGLYAMPLVTHLDRAALAIPVVALLVLTCAAAQEGNQPMPLAAFVALLTAIVASAVIGARRPRKPARKGPRNVLAYATYLGTAALIPAALWVSGVYGRLGIA